MTCSQKPAAALAPAPTAPPSGNLYVGPSLARSLVGLAVAVLTGHRA